MKIALIMDVVQTRYNLEEDGRNKAACQWTTLPGLYEMV
jgi:hypothetical protein